MSGVLIDGEALEWYQNLFISDAIKEVIGNIPSIYALLPYEQHWVAYAKYTLTYTTYDDTIGAFQQYMPNWNSALMNRTSIYNNLLFLSTGEHITTLVDSYYIVGKDRETINFLTFKKSGGKFNEVSIDTTNDGDGTVTLQSATIGETLDLSKTYYTTASHTDMINGKNTDTINQIIDWIQN